MGDRDWMVPSIVLTVATGAVALPLMPDLSGVFPAIGILPFWMTAAAILASIYGFATMIAARVPRPLAHIRQLVTRDWRWLLMFVFGIFLAGLNMTTFMWIKPLLNYLVPFHADPMLAAIDHALFLGHDPWTLFTWLNTLPMALFYHRVWFILMIITLFGVLTAPASPRKSAMMVTYFALWSIVGPVIHSLLPAAGPIFYERLGYGDRFATLAHVSETREVADYLWSVYTGSRFGPGSGISAMPSLHIATTTWIVLATWHFQRRIMIPVAIAAALIFMLSMALGWHYAADGIVGAAATIGCFRLLLALFRQRAARNEAIVPVPAVA
ncbi:MAG TPA: phosphatase PAP2 family protein [Sphingomonas sp.]|nr:phosphatase PAP2 family protein [Sphingomonas sp.]